MFDKINQKKFKSIAEMFQSIYSREQLTSISVSFEDDLTSASVKDFVRLIEDSHEKTKGSQMRFK